MDVIEILTDSKRPRKSWNDLKKKLSEEGSELSEKIGQLKMLSSDGKRYLADIADTEGILRLAQSIPSPKAEPFKLWLARQMDSGTIVTIICDRGDRNLSTTLFRSVCAKCPL